MPRDSKGQLFGIGSMVSSGKGNPCKVVGFATAARASDLVPIAKAMKKAGYCVHNWREIWNLDPHEKGHEDSTDLCPVDRRTVAEGLESAVLANHEGHGDKVVWGE